ncbi:hypothetical protein [Terriglobus tenax]|uniref:hypothetical protein n=1 Tax=Terriglobus tenax TaxID=1111115 RepID=UPI0021E0C818|nr:hypothetical protein [Terriglobus tenax]
MDVTLANTEPYYQFHRFSEEFNRNVRISVAGLAYVRKQQRTASGPVPLPSDGEPFGKNQWNSPGKEVPSAKGFVAAMGVARMVTILEDFCVGVQAEHSRWAALQGKPVSQQPQSEDDAEGISPKALYKQLGWNTSSIQEVEPLYEYFAKLRNCIVHRSGRANAELNRYAAGARLKSCVENWSGPRKKKLPALPAVVLGEFVSVLPRHAILACEVSRRIAIDSNARLLNYLGDEGVVYMAAHHSLLSKRPIATNARKSAQALLNTILTGRYRVKLAERTEAVHLLSEIDKWKPYLRKFERLYS